MAKGFTSDPNQMNQILLKRKQLVNGGVDILIVGQPGCGKTSVLTTIACATQKINNDVIVWRSGLDCQWTLFKNIKPTPKLILWLKEDVEFNLVDRNTENNIKLEKYFYKVKRWKHPSTLVKNLSRKYINIIQTTPFNPMNTSEHVKFCRDWLSIFQSLNNRYYSQSIAVFFDELEDLVPEAKGKEFWDVELSFSSLIRSLRKNYISTFFACHSRQEIHWRILKKIRWFMYMRGGKQPKYSRLKANMNKLKIGDAWIEGDQIERLSFEPVGNEHMIRAIPKKK